MAKQFDAFTDDHRQFIAAQHMFFSGTAANEGRVNISPKGMDSLRVLGPNRVIWRNLTGSGNETAAHLVGHNRMTLMWCGFEKRPLILRVYGTARTLHPRDADFTTLNAHFEPTHAARQIFDMTVDLVQTSCGWAIPYLDFAGPRDTLAQWADTKTPQDIETHWHTRNQHSIDGLPTHIADNGDA